VKNFKSYNVLDRFKEDLLANSFVDLPNNPSKLDLQPFENIFVQFHEAFYNALLYDLNLMGINTSQVSLLESIFIPEDEDAQKASLCFFYLEINIMQEVFRICFKYLVFQQIIHCYFYNNLAKTEVDHFINNKNNFISTLAKKYKKNQIAHLYEFR